VAQMVDLPQAVRLAVFLVAAIHLEEGAVQASAATVVGVAASVAAAVPTGATTAATARLEDSPRVAGVPAAALAVVDAVEVAAAAEDVVADVTGPVRIAVIVMDPVRIAVIATDPVRIAVRTAAMDLVRAVAPGDPGVEVAVEARRNSAWTRRLSLLWVRLPLKVKESKKFQTTTFSSRANTDY